MARSARSGSRWQADLRHPRNARAVEDRQDRKPWLRATDQLGRGGTGQAGQARRDGRVRRVARWLGSPADAAGCWPAAAWHLWSGAMTAADITQPPRTTLLSAGQPTLRAVRRDPRLRMGFIDGSVVSLAMPAIRADLGASLVDAQWISNAYVLFLSALVLLGGAAGDVFGVRNIFSQALRVHGDVARLRVAPRRGDADRDAGCARHRRRLHGAGQPRHHRQGLPEDDGAGRSASGRPSRR